MLVKLPDSKINDLLKKGLNAYIVKVIINKNSQWLAIRNLQIYNDLAAMGELIASEPNLQEIENESVSDEFNAIICCKRKKGDIENMLGLIPDVQKVFAAAFEFCRSCGAEATG